MCIFMRSVCMAIAAITVVACSKKNENKVVTPWGEVLSDTVPASNTFSVSDITANGELIMLTMSGADTYFDYHGRGLGTQYLLCEKFAQRLGVSLRVEVCKDTAEMVTRLERGDADLIAFMLPKKTAGNKKLIFCGAGIDSLDCQWAVGSGSRELADSLNAWYRPEMYASIVREQNFLLSSASVKRHVYAPFLNRSGGVISRYDHLFKRYAPIARLDWRLMAAQCYQESCFDPDAKSWAGARGLMQIMPSTASHLGLPMSSIHDPEQNVKAAAKLLAELSARFRQIPNATERQCFMLASYNGGYFHIQDAMALARKRGKNHHRWNEVAPYVLALEKPQYYNDPVVRYGYMRGSETVGYVERIRQRYASYRGVPYGGSSVRNGADDLPADDVSPFVPHKAKHKHRFHI